MKLSLDPAVTAPRAITSESLALSAWYDAHPCVRRMWAIRCAHALRVIIALEPTVDNSDTTPTWLANREAWIGELSSGMEGSVTLELIDEPLLKEIETDARGDIVLAMSWRDPALASFD